MRFIFVSSLFHILFLLSGIAKAAGQDSIPVVMMTFEQALDYARQKSPVLKQAQLARDEKAEMARAARGLYFPKVGVTATYMVLPGDLSLDLTPVRDAIVPLYSALGNYGVFSGVPNPDPNTNAVMPVLPDNLSTQAVRGQLQEGLSRIQSAEWDRLIQKKQFGTVAATMQWPLYTGGRINAAGKAAGIEFSEAGEIIRLKEGELISELAERYFGLSLARQAVMVRSDVLKGMQRHLSDAEKMHRDGLIANAEVLQARFYHAQADRELKKARNTADVLNNALHNTLASSGAHFRIETLSALFYLDSLPPVEYFTAIAVNKNPSLQMVESKKQLAGINHRISRAEYLPTIAVQGMYDIANADLSPYAPEWMVGVGMKWTLFDGTARYHKVKAAAAKSAQVEMVEEKAQADIATAIFKLYNELNSFREQLYALGSAMVFAEEYLKVREKGFREEMSNATEVLDARLKLAQVRMERLQVMYGYDLALAKLLQFTGIPEKFSEYATSPLAVKDIYQPIND